MFTKLLVDAGSDLNIKDKRYNTPLDRAKAQNHTCVTNYLSNYSFNNSLNR